MRSTQVVEYALALPETERIELARKLIASVASDREAEQLMFQGAQRIADIFSGRIAALTEAEFRRAVK
jgi:hypothetical protein